MKRADGGKKRDRKVVLTDRFCQTVKAEDERVEWSDKKLYGLKLRVWRTPDGQTKRAFSATFKTVSGVRRRFKLGTIPPLSLAQAREKAREVLSEAQLGGDPQASRVEQRKTSTETIGKLLDLWISENGDRWARSTLLGWTGMARVWKAEIGDLKLSLDELELADRIESYLRRVAKTNPVVANRRHACIRTCFRWARERRLIKHNPIDLVTKKPGGREKPRAAVFTDDQLRIIDKVSSEEGWQSLWRLVAFTAVRLSEALKASWPEFDLKSATWTIPPERTKTDEAYVIPLSDGVLRTLAEIKEANLREGWGNQHLLFPSVGRKAQEGQIVPKAPPKLAGVKRALGADGLSMVFHDTRRTVRSRLPGLEIRPGIRVTPDIAERCLNHAIGGVRRVYERFDFLPQVREALDVWGVELDSILSEGRIQSR